MGFAYQGVCHNTAPQAQAQFCQKLTMTGLTSTGTIVSTACASTTATTVTVNRLNGTTTSTHVITNAPFLNCTYDGGASLSLEYFALALGFVAVIAAAKAIVNVFRGRTDFA